MKLMLLTVLFASSLASAATIKCGAYHVWKLDVDLDGQDDFALLSGLKSFDDSKPFAVSDRNADFSYSLERKGGILHVVLENPLSGNKTELSGSITFDEHFRLAVPATANSQGKAVDALELWCGH